MRLLLLCCTSLLLLASCNFNGTGPDHDDGLPADTTHFRDVSASAIPASIQPNNAKDVTSADIGNDGDSDLISAMQNGSNRMLLNNGEGIFTEQTPSVIASKSLDSEAVVAADYNGNAIIDLFFASQQDQTNEFYLNQGHGVYLDISNQLPVTGDFLSAATADVNNDGNTDLVIGNDGQNYLLLNTGNAFFNPVPERIPSLRGITPKHGGRRSNRRRANRFGGR